MAPVPFLGLNFNEYNNSIAGIRKAKVLPEPVLAAPRTSLPASSGGIVRAWTSVGGGGGGGSCRYLSIYLFIFYWMMTFSMLAHSCYQWLC